MTQNIDCACFTYVKNPQISKFSCQKIQQCRKQKIPCHQKLKAFLSLSTTVTKQGPAVILHCKFFCSSTSSPPDWVLLGDETHMANLLGRKRESTIYDWAQLFNEPSKSLCRSPKRQSDLFSPNTPQPLRFGQYYALYMVHSAATCLLLQFVVFEVLVQGVQVQSETFLSSQPSIQ